VKNKVRFWGLVENGGQLSFEPVEVGGFVGAAAEFFVEAFEDIKA